MPRETTIKLEFELEDLSSTPTPFVLIAPGLTKSTAAGTAQTPATTTIHYDQASPPNPLPAVGDLLMVTGTGWKSLDGKLHRVTAVDSTTTHTITIAADTFAENAALPGTLTNIHVTAPKWSHACLTEFSTNPGTPGEVDATTMCDTERVTLAGLPSPGTVSFTLPFDLDDAGFLALEKAHADGLPRYIIAKTRRGQMAIFHGVVSAFSIGSLGVEQAIMATGSVTLDRSPTFAKAA